MTQLPPIPIPPEIYTLCQRAQDEYRERAHILIEAGPIVPEAIEIATVEARRVNSREILREIQKEKI